MPVEKLRCVNGFEDHELCVDRKKLASAQLARNYPLFMETEP
jgi:hypothetical protein